MIIKDGQGVTAPGGSCEVAFEIHLPEVVRFWMFETSKALMLCRRFRRDLLVPMQNRGDGTGGRDPGVTQSQEPGPQLAAAPSRVLGAQGEYLLFDAR